MTTLDTKSGAVLVALEHDADRPICDVAKRIGAREHTVRYVLDRLKSRGIIVGRAPFINLYRLGYTDYTLFFSLASRREKPRDRMVEELLKTTSVSWVGKVGGEFQYGAAVCARSIGEAMEVFHALSDRVGCAFLDKALSLRVTFTAYGRKYLAPKVKISPLAARTAGHAAAIDDVDHRILSALSRNPELSWRDLSAGIGVPLSTVLRRAKQLEAEGVIQGYIYRLSSAALGMQQYRLLIYTRGMSLALSTALREFAERHPQVIHFIECMGAWDYELGVEVKHAENVTEIAQQIYDRYGTEIGNIRLLQIFRHLKYSSYPFAAEV